MSTVNITTRSTPESRVRRFDRAADRGRRATQMLGEAEAEFHAAIKVMGHKEWAALCNKRGWHIDADFGDHIC